MMINRTTKAKRRRQAAEARLIEAALLSAADFGAIGANNGGWPTCHALNVQAGVNLIPSVAQAIAHYPRGSKARDFAAWQAGWDSRLVDALGGASPDRILARAGIL